MLRVPLAWLLLKNEPARLLIGIGWSMVVFIAAYRSRKSPPVLHEVRLDRPHSVEVAFLGLATVYFDDERVRARDYHRPLYLALLLDLALGAGVLVALATAVAHSRHRSNSSP